MLELQNICWRVFQVTLLKRVLDLPLSHTSGPVGPGIYQRGLNACKWCLLPTRSSVVFTLAIPQRTNQKTKIYLSLESKPDCLHIQHWKTDLSMQVCLSNTIKIISEWNYRFSFLFKLETPHGASRTQLLPWWSFVSQLPHLCHKSVIREDPRGWFSMCWLSCFSGAGCCSCPGFQLCLGVPVAPLNQHLPHGTLDICLDLLPTTPRPRAKTGCTA